MAKKAPKKKAAAKRAPKLKRVTLTLAPAGGACPTGYHQDGYVVINGVTYPNCVPD